jgi:signal transduction histidine kinase
MVFFKMIFTIANAGFLPWIILALGVTLLVNYALVNHITQLRPAYFRLIVSSFLLLHIVSYDCGGIRTAGTFYFAVVILYAYMLLGPQSGRLFVVAAIAHVIYLYFISTYTGLTSFSMFKNDVELISQDFLVNGILVIFLTASQANYLQSGRNIMINRLESANAALEAKNVELEQKNKLLLTYANGLEKTNQDLEKFASVASHDLKAPLRAIGTLTDLIEEEQGSTFSVSTEKNFSTIRNRVNRMEVLINSLLDYSKIRNAGSTIKPFMVDELLENLRSAAAIHGDFELTNIGEVKEMVADQKQLQNVLNHLVVNAIVHHHGVKPCIEIVISENDKEYTFKVKDNGPGIDHQNHERIFGLFQTLKPRDDFESAGAGLAICKTIVETAGGSIWVLSKPGEGAEFHFTWPKRITSRPETPSRAIAYQ